MHLPQERGLHPGIERLGGWRARSASGSAGSASMADPLSPGPALSAMAGPLEQSLGGLKVENTSAVLPTLH